GDTGNNLAGTPDTIVNTADVDGNVDGLRLRQAYRTGDAKATPIVPTNRRFAEPVVPASFNGFANPGAGNPQLYRVSTGHGGVMCEGCHGATHAEWPNANPASNDNITAGQLQGHTGTIVECDTCHTGSLGNTLNGPHGMHVVGNTSFADGGHEHVAENNRNACRACHGQNGEGSVLSRTAADRNLPDIGFVPRGTPIRCNMCHSNEL
ncbi:MAG TPA: cytochrome C, partial [Gammaproteobacteria bacterium]|nr:cytochrome C [Gammaproteobacteria bacterium]